MNIVTSKKTFGDVRVDEKVYVIDPKSAQTIAITVVASRVHPKSKNGAVWVIEAYMPFRLESIKDESLKEAAKYGTKVTQQFFVPKHEHCVLLSAKVPTIMATEEKYIEQWKKRNASGLILPTRMG